MIPEQTVKTRKVSVDSDFPQPPRFENSRDNDAFNAWYYEFKKAVLLKMDRLAEEIQKLKT